MRPIYHGQDRFVPLLMRKSIDRDLASLYEVDTRQLTRQVRRNIERFPEDFMFQLTKEEIQNLMCQIGTSSWGGARKLPYAFTEQGVAMLSGILRSKRAVQVNIQIMRVFIQLKRMLLTNAGLKRKIDEMEPGLSICKSLTSYPDLHPTPRTTDYHQQAYLFLQKHSAYSWKTYTLLANLPI
ncbi:MAG: ORF6N domain-containing protein [Candidatus Omnitrophica bacterium]|nr:ORF6N domain-containing protein [Candidatus Omnitrophota bacterium]